MNILNKNSFLSDQVKRNLNHHEKNLINLSDTSDYDSNKDTTQESELDPEFAENIREL